MACQGWGDGDSCVLKIDEKTKISGIVAEIDSRNHRLLVKVAKAPALTARMMGLDESKRIKDAFWIDARLAMRVAKHGA